MRSICKMIATASDGTGMAPVVSQISCVMTIGSENHVSIARPKYVRTIDAIRIFFFASIRRQTRLQGDWSSDVCSSDLGDFVEDIDCLAVRIAPTDDLTGSVRCGRAAHQNASTYADGAAVAAETLPNAAGVHEESCRRSEERRGGKESDGAEGGEECRRR